MHSCPPVTTIVDLRRLRAQLPYAITLTYGDVHMALTAGLEY